MATLTQQNKTQGFVGQDPITPFNDEEAKKLEDLKITLGDDLTTGRHAEYPEVVGDINLLRHLRGLVTVKEAAKKFRKGLEMRKQYNLDDIRDEWANKSFWDSPESIWNWKNCEIEDFGKSVGGMGGSAGPTPLTESSGWPKSTLSGHMYNCISVADWQPGSKTEGFLSRNSDEEFLRFQFIDIIVHQMRFDRMSRHHGYMVKVCFVWDFNGVTSMFQMQNKEWTRRTKLIDELRANIHIEYLGAFYLINASWIVRKLWGMVQMALPKKTVQKVIVAGEDYRDEILKEFSPKVVANLIKYANKKTRPSGDNDAEGQRGLKGSLQISAGNKKEVVVDLDTAQEVSWTFTPTSRDINFSATITGVNGTQMTVVENARYSAEQGIVHGEIKPGTVQGGILVLCWDNGHSWMRGNGVDYEITVVAKKKDGETKE